jgi:hypothetical protein
MSIKFKVFSADNAVDFEDSINRFFDEYPDIERKDLIKTYFTCVPVADHKTNGTSHVQTYGFIVYEDIFEDVIIDTKR